MHRCSPAVRLTLLALVLLTASGLPAPARGSAQATGNAAVSASPATLIELSAHSSARDARPSLRVLASTEDYVRLEFELPALRSQELQMGDEVYHLLEIDGGGVAGAIGEPMLPTYGKLIQIPDRAGATLTVVGIETTELAGYRPLPMQPDESTAFVVHPAAYSSAGYAETSRARIGEPAVARDLRVVPLVLHPVRFDPARSTLEVARRIQVEVRFAGEDLRNVKQRQARIVPASFDKIYRNTVINYSGPREGQILGNGTYVIICPDNYGVVDAVQPLVEWRTRKGFDVHLVTTDETGSQREEIQAWLRNAYETWDNPPEYVTLVGDASYSQMRIRTWFEPWSGRDGEGDHPYVQLDGDDILADAHIGRISASLLDHLEVYMAKIVPYESTPYIDETDWYPRACLVGDPSESGYTCVQIMQWLKRRLLEWGYAEVDTIFEGPWVSQMVNDLNQGNTIFCYRGFFGMSGFETGDIFALQNGRKMPFAVNVTCSTGSFASGTSPTEAWIRAGSAPDNVTGGIASIGTATGGTHTRFNNCMTYGIWHGILWEEMTTFGAALTRGEYELFINYGEADPLNAAIFTHWNNLMGDPAGELWTGVPQPMTVDHPAAIALGANVARVTVTDGSGPCAGATVCLWKDGETHSTGVTGSDGVAELAISPQTTGALQVTVTKHDHLPYLAAIEIVDPALFVGYADHLIDDDNAGGSTGNGDGQPNPAEQIELPVQVQNFGTQTANEVSGTLSTADAYVTVTADGVDFGTLPGGVSAWGGAPFGIAIDPAAPDGHLLRLGLDLRCGADTWHSLIEIPVVAAALTYEDLSLYGFGTLIDPGEVGEIGVVLHNDGHAAAEDLTAQLISRSTWVTVTDGQGTFGTLTAGLSGENSGDLFGISVSADCFQGHVAAMLLALEHSASAVDTIAFALQVGVTATNDPTGPDLYGYYAFDNSDTAYDQAPVYEWIEIAANHGGSGVPLGLDDDESITIDLPFAFTYYGETFTRATICSNGWIAMGHTYLTNYRNWNIPGAGAPPYLITPMWDNLYPDGEDTVYHWHDAPNHRYVVQWSRMRNREGDTLQNFEVILYDPEHHPTATGDGAIIFQYDVFNNSDYLQHYSTTGIQNGDMSDGVMYQYFDLYNAGAASIGSGTAILFMALPTSTLGTLAGVITNATDGGTPLEGATVRLIETGATMQSGLDGSFAGAVQAGTYTVTASHPSFATQTVPDVTILEGQTTELNFAMVDTVGPSIDDTTVHGNTSDTLGPYDIWTTVTDYSTVIDLSLVYNVNDTGWTTLALADQGDDLYWAAIPGQPHTTRVRYYITGQDSGDNVATDPTNAPDDAYAFWVMPPLVGDDMEAGIGGWTHYVVTGGYNDEWHRSESRNHTPGGSWSWKFGASGGGAYTDLADGALVTEPVALDGDATLVFYHWMEAETSSSYPGYAYDGGVVELSLDGGPWTEIDPVGGYPYLARPGSSPGPFPEDTPLYSGQFDWTAARFELIDLHGSARVRFRFGSDGGEGMEGWYIDDLEIMGSEPPTSAIPPEPPRPTTLQLGPIAPNPFCGPSTTALVPFALPVDGGVSLRIIDAGGRLVRTLVTGRLPAGWHRVAWDGRDADARVVGSGVYFYVLEAGGQQRTRRILVLQ